MIDISTGYLSSHSPTLCKMHGLKENPTNVAGIIDLIHPEDINFVLEAERACYNRIKELTPINLLELKTSYCFRMKVRSGTYEMFHHQALHTRVSAEGVILQSVNIHTNIEHICSTNRFTALITGIGTREDFIQLEIKEKEIKEVQLPITKRELEIVRLIAKGLGTKAIATELSISPYTVDTHRKNLLSKANCKTSSELIRKAYEVGII